MFSVTIATRDRERVFEDRLVATRCIEALRAVRARKGNPVYAYCLMPDHAHVLVGIVRDASLPSFVASWKSLCYQARRTLGNAQPFWQRGYFDHAVRSDEDVRTAALYILNNPVRRQLVCDFHDFPFGGSLEFDL